MGIIDLVLTMEDLSMIATQFHAVNVFFENALTTLATVQNQTTITFPTKVSTPILKK